MFLRCPFCRKALEALALEGVKKPLVIDLTGWANTVSYAWPLPLRPRQHTYHYYYYYYTRQHTSQARRELPCAHVPFPSCLAWLFRRTEHHLYTYPTNAPLRAHMPNTCTRQYRWSHGAAGASWPDGQADRPKCVRRRDEHRRGRRNLRVAPQRETPATLSQRQRPGHIACT